MIEFRSSREAVTAVGLQFRALDPTHGHCAVAAESFGPSYL